MNDENHKVNVDQNIISLCMIDMLIKILSKGCKTEITVQKCVKSSTPECNLALKFDIRYGMTELGMKMSLIQVFQVEL